MRLPRPYIPLGVRVQVAHRQIMERKLWSVEVRDAIVGNTAMLSVKLTYALALLFEGRKVELHHRPALENRQQILFHGKFVRYEPDANDPAFLVYLENNAANNDHYIETHVRGVGAQRSDTGQRNHQKRMDENRGLRQRRPKAKITQRKNPWQKGRKMQSRPWRFRFQSRGCL